MPSARRESIRFSNTQPKHQNNYHHHHQKVVKQVNWRRVTVAPKRPSRVRHAKLIDVTPHAWRYSLVDPHWVFLVRTRTPEGTLRRYLMRYSDFENLAQNKQETMPEVLQSLPQRHWIPFWGKMFDCEDTAKQRASELRRAIMPLFTYRNPQQAEFDCGEALEPFEMTLPDFPSVGV